MATGGATVTGLAELRAMVHQLPASTEAALRTVARDSALRIAAGMRRRLPAEGSTIDATGITRASVVVTPNVEERLYRAEVGPAPPHLRHGRSAFLPNLPVWLEFGTKNMTARPFLRPSVDEEDATYRANARRAAEKVAEELLG